VSERSNGSAPVGVLIDVDGTLLDTNYLHTIAWWRGLDDVGEWAPMNAIHGLVGMGSDQLVPRLLGHDAPGVVEARTRHYKPLLAEARPFPGAGQLLRHLHERGVRVVLASSSPKDELQVMVDRLDVGGAIDAVTSADDVDRSKPQPDVFLAAARAGQLSVERCLAVGDSVWDVQAARAAGVGLIGVETGGFSAHELREEGALGVYRDVAELDAQLLTSPLGTLLAMMR
jgi:HAD superfamily hydrolase (TIGR01509 family)